jgi:hypothetical protein
MNLIGRALVLLADTLPRAFRVGAAAFVLCGVPSVAFAQVQDDAALADVHDDKPVPAPAGAPSSIATTPARTGFDDRSETTNEERQKQEAELDPPLTTAELRVAHPDLQFRVTSPPTLTVSLTSIYPFQPFGIGLGYELYALPWLRLNALMSVGGTPTVNDRWRVSLYAETGIGIVLLRSPSQVVTEIKELPTLAGRNFHSKRASFDRFMFGEEPPPPGSFVRALVPAFHSLELEAGGFSGQYPLYRCTANCAEDPSVIAHTNEDASLQVTAIYAGLRYVYFRWARSEQVPFVSRFGVEAAVDAITNPFTPRDPNLFNLRDSHPVHDPVGVRVKLRIIGAKCAANGPCVGFDLMGGYLPTPADALVSANVVLD